MPACLHDNSKTNDPKVFKLGIGNVLGISYKWYDFGIERSKVKVTGSQRAKHIEGDRVTGVSYAFYRVPSLYIIIMIIQYYTVDMSLSDVHLCIKSAMMMRTVSLIGTASIHSPSLVCTCTIRFIQFNTNSHHGCWETLEACFSDSDAILTAVSKLFISFRECFLLQRSVATWFTGWSWNN